MSIVDSITLFPDQASSPRNENEIIQSLMVYNDSNCWVYYGTVKIADPYQKCTVGGISATILSFSLTSTAPAGQQSPATPVGSCKIDLSSDPTDSNPGFISANQTIQQNQIDLGLYSAISPINFNVSIPPNINLLLIEFLGAGNTTVRIVGNQSGITWYNNVLSSTNPFDFCNIGSVVDSSVQLTIFGTPPVHLIGLQTATLAVADSKIVAPNSNLQNLQIGQPYNFLLSNQSFAALAVDRLLDSWSINGAAAGNVGLTLTQPAAGANLLNIITSFYCEATQGGAAAAGVPVSITIWGSLTLMLTASANTIDRVSQTDLRVKGGANTAVSLTMSPTLAAVTYRARMSGFVVTL